MMEANKQGFWVECNVCNARYKNLAGSTPCCGALAYEVDENGNKTNRAVLHASINEGHIETIAVEIESKKPPIGISPRYIWENRVKIERANALILAIRRYEDANLEPAKEWLEELEQLKKEIISGIQE